MNVSASNMQYCLDHRPSRRCKAEGCTKCAQGATDFCISHGGGRRCTFPGCTKGARDKQFCAGHGGGRRCTQPGCTKSAVGKLAVSVDDLFPFIILDSQASLITALLMVEVRDVASPAVTRAPSPLPSSASSMAEASAAPDRTAPRYSL